jgi:serine/threonine protein kinase
MPEPKSKIQLCDREGPFAAGDRLHTYEILGQIGRGGFAYVYLGRHLLFGYEVAIKVIPRHDEKLALRARREAGGLMTLDHPNIVKMLDGGVLEDGAIYIVMEFLHGQSLRDLLRKERRLDPARALGYFIQIAAGVQAAHAQDVIHRDLKPENAVLVEDDIIKVLDFGIAKFLGAPPITGRKDRVQGTVPYMSPEHLQGRQVTVRSDVFAMGTMLYEALYRHPLFLGEEPPTMQEVVWRQMVMPPRLDEVDPAIPERIARTVERAIARVAEQRFESAQAFREALESDRSWLESRASERAFEPRAPARAGCAGSPDDTLPDQLAFSGTFATDAIAAPTAPGVAVALELPTPQPARQATEQLEPEAFGVGDIPSARTTHTLTPVGTPVHAPSRAAPSAAASRARSAPHPMWTVPIGVVVGAVLMSLLVLAMRGRQPSAVPLVSERGPARSRAAPPSAPPRSTAPALALRAADPVPPPASAAASSVPASPAVPVVAKARPQPSEPTSPPRARKPSGTTRPPSGTLKAHERDVALEDLLTTPLFTEPIAPSSRAGRRSTRLWLPPGDETPPARASALPTLVPPEPDPTKPLAPRRASSAAAPAVRPESRRPNR